MLWPKWPTAVLSIDEQRRKNLIEYQFCSEYNKDSRAYSIEDDEALTAIKESDLIVFANPVQFSF